MDNTASENIRAWIRDAHAMEEQAEQLFSGQADRLKDYYDLSSRITAELTYIKEHQVLLSVRIQQLGSSTSLVKDAAAKIVAGAQNISGMFVTDEPVKGVLSLYTFTYMAIGSYKVLIAAAEATHDSETRRVAGTILNYTEIRARWLESELLDITQLFLAQRP